MRCGSAACAVVLFAACTDVPSAVDIADSGSPDASQCAEPSPGSEPFALTAGQRGFFWSLTVAGDRLFVAGSNLRTLPLAGGCPETLETGSVRDVALDGDWVYWASGNRVKRRWLPGNGFSETLAMAPEPVAISLSATDVFYCGFGVRRVPKDGGEATLLAPRCGLALEYSEGYVYFSTDDGVARVRETGGDPEILASGRQVIRAIDVADGFVYFTEDPRLLARVPVSGGPVEILHDGGPWLRFHNRDATKPLAAENGHIAWSSGGEVRHLDLDTGTATTIAAAWASSVTIDGEDVYFATYELDEDDEPVDAAIYRAALQ